MPRINWEQVFSQRYPVKGATEAELLALTSAICEPLSKVEIQAIRNSQSNPFPETDPLHRADKPFDCRKWRLSSNPLPRAFLDFLRWSNGGSFFNGDRHFDTFFTTFELRDYLLSYHIPEYMPGSLPFAFDGKGCFYLFDMRSGPVEGEYPVLFTGSGNLGYDDAVRVAESFVETCNGTTDPADLYLKSKCR